MKTNIKKLSDEADRKTEKFLRELRDRIVRIECQHCETISDPVEILNILRNMPVDVVLHIARIVSPEGRSIVREVVTMTAELERGTQ